MARILLVCATPPRFDVDALEQTALSGTETANIELARQLALIGHDVVLATRTEQVVVHSENLRNIPLGQIGAERPDVVISSKECGIFDSWKPVTFDRVLWVHNALLVRRLLRRNQLGPFWRHKPRAVFPSVFTRDATASLLPFTGRSVIPHGISDCFHTTPPASRESRIAVWASPPWGLGETLEMWKNLVRPRVGDAEFHIFGRPPEPVRTSTDDLKRHGIFFHDRCTKADLARFYSGARMMIYPGWPGETFSLAAGEAQCAGLPVVTLGRGALRERVRTGIDGLLCTTSRQVASHVVRLLQDDGLWSLLHEGALSLRRVLTWERAARVWECELGIG